MTKSRYRDSQIISALNQAEAGAPVLELCHGHCLSNASYYKWRQTTAQDKLIYGSFVLLNQFSPTTPLLWQS